MGTCTYLVALDKYRSVNRLVPSLELMSTSATSSTASITRNLVLPRAGGDTSSSDIWGASEESVANPITPKL